MVDVEDLARLVLASKHGYGALRQDIASGALLPLRRGAYVEPADPDASIWDVRRARLHARCLAVADALKSPFAISHTTAASLYGWPTPIEDRVHILQSYRRGSEVSRDVIRHHCPDLREDDVQWLHGLPVTVPERTAIDCALTCVPPVGLAIADAALRILGAVSRFERDTSIARQDPIRAALLQRLASMGGVRHVRRARAVIAAANGLAESGGESWMRWLALANGLPTPELQYPIQVPATTLYADALWTFAVPDGEHVVIGEYDGVEKYEQDSGRAVAEQLHREQLIQDALGRVPFVRFLAQDRRAPDAAFARLLNSCPSSARARLKPARDLLIRPPRRT